MQSVTSAVRVDVALTLSRRCSLFASAKLDLDLDITAPTVQWTLRPDGLVAFGAWALRVED